jgi:threonine dehydratase
MKNKLVIEIEAARSTIRPYARKTELSFSPDLSVELDARIYFKWENHQPTGSFKIRGACNKILANLPDCQKKGVISASTGNHGLAVAFVCQQEKLDLTLYVPASISSLKRQKLEATGARLIFVDGTCEQAETQARQEAGSNGQIFVSPYNDEQVVAGQGTCGLEILEDLPEMEEVMVPVGGGGLIGGVAVYLKTLKPAIKITGIEPENSAFIKNSLDRGFLTNDFREKPTIAEAVAGGLEEGAITFDLIRKYVDRVITVKEQAIYQAIRLLFKHHQEKIEGAGALALAGLISYPEIFSGKKVVTVVSGGNLDDRLWRKIVNLKSG